MGTIHFVRYSTFHRHIRIRNSLTFEQQIVDQIFEYIYKIRT